MRYQPAKLALVIEQVPEIQDFSYLLMKSVSGSGFPLETYAQETQEDKSHKISPGGISSHTLQAFLWSECLRKNSQGHLKKTLFWTTAVYNSTALK